MSEKQVPRKHYFGSYVDAERLASYWNQIQEVMNCNPETILEVGIGNGFVSAYLESNGYEVTTVDIAKDLEPDIIEDVRSLTNSFDKNSFDVVLCAEVLEHIPFENFADALNEINEVYKKNIILTLPHFAADFSMKFKFPKSSSKALSLKIPFPKKHSFDGEHYWMIGKKNYPLKRIKKKLLEFFEIEKTYCPVENPHHRFFILK